MWMGCSFCCCSALVTVSKSVIDEVKRIISDSEITKYVLETLVFAAVLLSRVLVDREDDKEWPEPDRVGRQELEVVLDNDHISFTVRDEHVTSTWKRSTDKVCVCSAQRLGPYWTCKIAKTPKVYASCTTWCRT